MPVNLRRASLRWAVGVVGFLNGRGVQLCSGERRLREQPQLPLHVLPWALVLGAVTSLVMKIRRSHVLASESSCGRPAARVAGPCRDDGTTRGMPVTGPGSAFTDLALGAPLYHHDNGLWDLVDPFLGSRVLLGVGCKRRHDLVKRLPICDEDASSILLLGRVAIVGHDVDRVCHCEHGREAPDASGTWDTRVVKDELEVRQRPPSPPPCGPGLQGAHELWLTRNEGVSQDHGCSRRHCT